MDALTDLHMCMYLLRIMCMLCKYRYRRMTHTNRCLTHVHVRGPHQRAAHDSGRTRARNLWFRRPTPYPLGHSAHAISCRDHDGQLLEDSVGATDGWLDSSVLPGVGSIDHDPPTSLESPAPEADALSMRPTGQLIVAACLTAST